MSEVAEQTGPADVTTDAPEQHAVFTESFHGGKFYDPDKKTLNPEALGEAYTGAVQGLLKKREALKEEVRNEFEAEVVGARPADPDGYELKVEGLDIEVPPDDPTLLAFKNQAYELGLTDKAFNQIANSYLQAANASVAESNAANSAAELAKLGARGPDRIEAVATWVNKQLPADKAEALVGGYKDAKGGYHARADVIEALEMLMTKANPDMSLPAGAVADIPDRKTYELETRAMLRDPRYQSDEAFQAKVATRFQQLYPDEL